MSGPVAATPNWAWLLRPRPLKTTPILTQGNPFLRIRIALFITLKLLGCKSIGSRIDKKLHEVFDETGFEL